MTAKEALQVLIDNLEYPCDKEYDIVWNALNQLDDLEKVLSFVKEHTLLDGSVLRANFQWNLDVEENGKLLKEYLK